MVIVIDFLDAYLGMGSTGMWVKLPAARAICNITNYIPNLIVSQNNKAERSFACSCQS